MKNKIKFNHLGLAVKRFSDALAFYKNLGYHCTDPVIDSLQNVEIILCTSVKFPTVELIKPINDKSSIIDYLNEYSEMIYHICYEVENIETINKLFSNNRAICVSEPQPAILFDNRLVSFYYIPNVGLVEVLQKDAN